MKREDAILILEFMGYTKSIQDRGLQGKVEIWCNDLIYKGHYYTPFEAQYDRLWDFLMPVIEKIGQIDHEIYPRTFGMLNIDTGNPMFRFNKYFLHEAPTLIESAFEAVVEFIEYYNKGKNESKL